MIIQSLVTTIHVVTVVLFCESSIRVESGACG